MALGLEMACFGDQLSSDQLSSCQHELASTFPLVFPPSGATPSWIWSCVLGGGFRLRKRSIFIHLWGRVFLLHDREHRGSSFYDVWLDSVTEPGSVNVMILWSWYNFDNGKSRNLVFIFATFLKLSVCTDGEWANAMYNYFPCCKGKRVPYFCYSLTSSCLALGFALLRRGGSDICETRSWNLLEHHMELLEEFVYDWLQQITIPDSVS